MNPTQYQIVYRTPNAEDLETLRIQEVTYQLCHLYYSTTLSSCINLDSTQHCRVRCARLHGHHRRAGTSAVCRPPCQLDAGDVGRQHWSPACPREEALLSMKSLLSSFLRAPKWIPCPLRPSSPLLPSASTVDVIRIAFRIRLPEVHTLTLHQYTTALA